VNKFDEAWAPVKAHFLKYNSNIVNGYPGEFKPYNDGTGRRIVNLRLDTEIDVQSRPEDFDFNTLSEEHLDILWTMLKPDMEDVFENGDQNNTADALFKCFNGSKKRGQTLIYPAFPQVSIYREYKAGKERLEYAVYVVVYGEWE
jgi:hypothetical protein